MQRNVYKYRKALVESNMISYIFSKRDYLNLALYIQLR